MDLNEIVIFTRVVEAGSFTAAARRLDMPKSTVSRKVTALEARLGVRLLHRTTRQLRLTDVGATFHRHCVEVVAALAQAELAVTETQSSPMGSLRVTAPTDFGVRVLPPLIAKFLERFPDIRIDLQLTERMVDLVAEGFDLALRAARSLPDSSLIARKLGTSFSLAVATPSYLASHGMPQQPSDLTKHNFVLHRSNRYRSQLSFSREGQVEEITVSGKISVNEYGMVRELTLHHMGLAAVPDVVCAGDLRDGALVHVLPEWRMASSAIYALYPSAQHISASLRVFLDFLREEMEPAPWATCCNELSD